MWQVRSTEASSGGLVAARLMASEGIEAAADSRTQIDDGSAAKALAYDISPDTCVNCIAPGFVPTYFADFLVRNETIRKSIEENILLRRLGTVGDMAATAAFLASDDASYIIVMKSLE
ncbi:hypothetical protein J5N97_009638 [Dioscorea zingiberensis]|uniref:Uncharacterized protein n=1 Tax=Dioscorea zingiberensis TaxID=325984 RepID=A0A9D5CZR6_9LILI|nr:hypothetical protein J5N97_009638 [Dioscorea zingiberensis]